VPVTVKGKSQSYEISLGVPARCVLLLQLFVYRKRVLDSWVRKRIAVARREFARIPTVEERRLHVALPINVAGNLETDLSAKTFQSLFRENLIRIRIQGEGGAGKTSLACQLGNWAMAPNPNQRLASQLMLPVLIESEFAEVGLVETARGQLRELVHSEVPISMEFFCALLRKRRVLVVVDHLSEMSEETQRRFKPADPEFPVNALVVTTRSEGQLSNATVVEPSRLKGDRVSNFIEAYLARLEKTNLFLDDEEYFDNCRRLTRMVGKREITVLLARLYIDQIVKAKESDSTPPMPENVPDLMLGYLNELHADADDDIKRRTQDDAKKVAWLCVKDTFQPGAASRDEVLEQLKGKDAEERLSYLKSTLHLVRIGDPRCNQVQFALHPLAEYLAGLKYVEMYGKNSKHWGGFLRKADEKNIEHIRGFLLAVYDCLSATKTSITKSIRNEFAERCGLEPVDSELIIVEQACRSHGSIQDQILAGDFSGIEKIDLSDTEVTDISLLENFSGLETLELIRCTNVSDLAPLSKLSRLRLLELVETGIDDLTPLASLDQLISLNVNGTNVSVLDPLAGLPKLAFLHVKDSNVENIGALGRLENLCRLNLENTQVANIEVLIDLAKKYGKMQWVNLTNTNTPKEAVEELRGLLPDGFVLG